MVTNMPNHYSFKLAERIKKNQGNVIGFYYYLSFYLYIYPPESQESDGSTNRQGKQLPRPASGDAKTLLFA